jgi:hypothetical protein
MKPWHQYTEEGIAELAAEALNVAVAHIQDRLGVETGDFAGLYFSGNREGAMEAIFKQYIEQEIHWNQEITP